MDAPPVALVSLLTTDRRLIYRPVQHLTSCQSGVWKSSSLGSFQRTYGNSACGEHGVSQAVCPSGQRVISGGWTLSGWSGNDGRNAPDSSQPISENTWQIVTGGGNSGGQCLRAVAYCADN